MSSLLFKHFVVTSQVFIYASLGRIRKEGLMNSNCYRPASVKKWDPQVSRQSSRLLLAELLRGNGATFQPGVEERDSG